MAQTHLKQMATLLLLGICLFSCKSVEQYNQELGKPHSKKELVKDVDYAYAKLKKLHPRLYQYTSREKLDSTFLVLKSKLPDSMSHKEFYWMLMPVIAQVRQGHIASGIPQKRYDKKRLKELKKTQLDFNHLGFEYVEGKVFVAKTIASDTTFLGSEVLEVGGEDIKTLFEKYKATFSSDGYNTTFHYRRIALDFANYYRKHHGLLDSVSLKLKQGDSLYRVTYHRYRKEEAMEAQMAVDTLTGTKRVRLSREERSQQKTAFKQLRKEHLRRGYVPEDDEFTRSFTFKDTVGKIGYLAIKGWENGPYRRFYREAFQNLQASGAAYLIIDLRDNMGGRLDEVHYLYSFLADKPYKFIEKSETKTSFPFLKELFPPYGSFWDRTSSALATPFLVGHNLINSGTKDGKKYFNLPYNNSSKPHRLNFNGKIYLLVNGVSFSASSILAANLHGSGRATIVGEETGGAYNGTVAGHYKVMKLPSTKLLIRFGLLHIGTPYRNEPDGFGVPVSTPLQPLVNDWEQGRDTVLEWVLEAIRKEME